jgi:hypothetical protein
MLASVAEEGKGDQSEELLKNIVGTTSYSLLFGTNYLQFFSDF